MTSALAAAVAVLAAGWSAVACALLAGATLLSAMIAGRRSRRRPVPPIAVAAVGVIVVVAAVAAAVATAMTQR